MVAVLLMGAGARLLAQQDVQEGPLPVLNRLPAQVDGPGAGNAARNNDANSAANNDVLNNDAVIRMTKAGIGDGLIVQAVRTQAGAYRTGPDDLIALKQAGVGEPVISAMMARNSGLSQRFGEGAAARGGNGRGGLNGGGLNGGGSGAALRPVEVLPLSPEVDDPGVYWKNKQGQWEPLSAELVNYRSGGAAKSVLTRGIVRPDRNGKVSGPKSTLQLEPGTEMMILAARPADAVEFIVLRFREKSDRREFRVESGSLFHTETGSDRDQLEIPMRKLAPRLFAFTVPKDLKKGEYGVLPPGHVSGISFAGTMYTFAVRE